MAIKKGNKVTLDYTGTFENGEVFDSSAKHGQPLTFTVGAGQVIPGFDLAVYGMEKGQAKDFTIPAKEAYGERNDQMIQTIPRKSLGTIEPKVGLILGINIPDGGQLPAVITKVDAEHVTLDLNHPLAGKNLHFKITILNVA